MRELLHVRLFDSLKIRTPISCTGRVFTTEPPGKPQQKL